MKIKQQKKKTSLRLASFETLENKYYGKKGKAKGKHTKLLLEKN